MSKLISLALAGLILAGCAGVQAEAVGRGRAAADAAANVFVADDCAMSYGAFLRRPANERLGIRLICDPAALEDIFGRLIQ